MFIEIDEEIMELLDVEKYLNFFNELAHNITNGTNYVFITKRLLEKLYKNPKIDNSSRQIYKNIFDNSAQDLVIKRSVNRIAKVVNNGKNEIEKNEFEIEDENEKKKVEEIIIPIDIAIDVNLFIKESNLIGENHSDCQFLQNIGDAYKAKKSINAINIKLRNIQGGGATISDEYKVRAKEKEISLFIVDTDQKYIGSAKGSTLRKLLKEERENKCEACEIYELPVHEIENIIPLKMIKKYYDEAKGEEERNEVIDFLESLEKNDFEKSPLAFFDMKNGISMKKWIEEESYKQYWKNVLDDIQFEYCEEYEYDEKKEAYNPKYIINGFGSKLLDKINEFWSENYDEIEFLRENVDEYVENTWEDIGALVYSYGCARQRGVVGGR